MIETTLPRAPELWATVPAPDPIPLLEQLATLRPTHVDGWVQPRAARRWAVAQR